MVALSHLFYGELLETDFMLNQCYFQKAYIDVTIATVGYLMAFADKNGGNKEVFSVSTHVKGNMQV